MQQGQDLYARVTRLRVEAFDLIQQLSRALDEDDADPRRTLALVRMQAIANNLGRVQGDLGVSRSETVRAPEL